MSAGQAPHLTDATNAPQKRSRLARIMLISVVSLTFVASAVEGYLLYSTQKRASRGIREEKWERLVSEYYLTADSISPQVGIIQFLKNGLSVTINSANYTTNGLELTGELGNARNVTISSITLHMTALHPIYSLRDKYLAGEDLSYTIQGQNLVLSGAEVGNGQTSTGDLLPGRKQFFSLTIPNVKQTERRLICRCSCLGNVTRTEITRHGRGFKRPHNPRLSHATPVVSSMAAQNKAFSNHMFSGDAFVKMYYFAIEI